MANLSVEVTHSLSFLTNTLRDLKKLTKSIESSIDSLYRMNLKEDGAPGQIRKKSADFREDADDEIEFILSDFKLFQKDMSDIVKYKNDETVIYSLKIFRNLYKDYKEFQKELKKLTRRTDVKASKCARDKDFIRYIALNKTIVPLYKIEQIVDACIYALEHLLEDRKEEKKEA